MIGKLKGLLENDMRQRSLRWQWLWLTFILVYFGEVVWSRLTGQLTSPERQFLIYWFVASIGQLIPFEFSVGAGFLGTIALMLVTWLRPGSGLTQDLGTWVLFFIATALVVAFIKQRRDT